MPRRCFFALALWALLAAAGCDGGGGPDATPTPSETPTPAAFLPIPTVTPQSTDPPGTRLGQAGKCPPLPQPACAMPGETINPYQALEGDGIASLHVWQYGDPAGKWALDRVAVQQVVRFFDRDLLLEPYSIPITPDPERLFLDVLWSPGEGPAWGDGTLDQVDFVIDPEAGVMGHSLVRVQWALSDGFLDALLASLSDATPTPRPPEPTLTPTPTIVPAGTVRFDHPEGELVWDGPDERLRSRIEAHCGNYDVTQAFGVPGLITVGRESGYWLNAAIRPPEGLHWTGYRYRDWRIMQGDDPFFVYLTHEREPRVAFAYESHICF